jgi:hypothetical protein
MTILLGPPGADGSTEISALEEAVAEITVITAPSNRVSSDFGGIQAT